jgi:hypothetical protein
LLPRAAIALALALGPLALGCACPDATVVLPIERYRYEALQKSYGWEALPDYECDAICFGAETPPECTSTTAAGGEGGFVTAGGAGGAGGAPGTGGSAASGAAEPIDCAPYEGFAYVSECKLSTIDWTRPAVVCAGTVQCM